MDIHMVWMIGGPGSGKGTQSLRIARKYGFMHIDPSALVKKEADVKGTTDNRFKTMLIRGNEVPLSDILPLMEREKDRRAAKGYVIDGYPGNIEEAGILERAFGPPDIVIALEVEQEASLRRTSSTHYIAHRPSLSEYTLASRAVMHKYEDIVLKVDSSQEPDNIFDVIQFNIDSLNQYQRRLTEEGHGVRQPRAGSIYY